MKLKNENLKREIMQKMAPHLTVRQLGKLESVISVALATYDDLSEEVSAKPEPHADIDLVEAFLSAKRVEGCSEKTIAYYQSSIRKLVTCVGKDVGDMSTDDIRQFLATQQLRGLGMVSIDNLRRIFSSLFSWLEDEDYITKSPARRIRRVRTAIRVKEVLSDEHIEVLHDGCLNARDLAMVDILLSTGMRVGELVKINRQDVDFAGRRCIVFGKGNKEREVYFNARTKIHLERYLATRTDTCPALFVSLSAPHTRLTVSGVEIRMRTIGRLMGLGHLHPHKFRRTFATMAIERGMPIEQVQHLLGHVKIDTTLHYAMVNQTNVRNAHRKYIV